MPRSEFQVLNGRHPVDGGTLYFETDLDALIQEPFNMASAAVLPQMPATAARKR